MKNILVFIGVLALYFSSSSALAADRVVVIPLGSKKISFERVYDHYTIPGTTFLPLRYYNRTEANGYIVNILPPGNYTVGNAPFGISHNKDGQTMDFTAPVHLPNGSAISNIGVAVCSEDESLDNHNIEISLVATDKSYSGSGPLNFKALSLAITSTDCFTLQELPDRRSSYYVDNSKYTYEFRVKGIEGGTCAELDCDDRRTQIQFANIRYSTKEVVQP